jgi:hypothetical protein
LSKPPVGFNVVSGERLRISLERRAATTPFQILPVPHRQHGRCRQNASPTTALPPPAQGIRNTGEHARGLYIVFVRPA